MFQSRLTILTCRNSQLSERPGILSGIKIGGRGAGKRSEQPRKIFQTIQLNHIKFRIVTNLLHTKKKKKRQFQMVQPNTHIFRINDLMSYIY